MAGRTGNPVLGRLETAGRGPSIAGNASDAADLHKPGAGLRDQIASRRVYPSHCHRPAADTRGRASTRAGSRPANGQAAASAFLHRALRRRKGLPARLGCRQSAARSGPRGNAADAGRPAQGNAQDPCRKHGADGARRRPKQEFRHRRKDRLQRWRNRRYGAQGCAESRRPCCFSFRTAAKSPAWRSTPAKARYSLPPPTPLSRSTAALRKKSSPAWAVGCSGATASCMCSTRYIPFLPAYASSAMATDMLRVFARMRASTRPPSVCRGRHALVAMLLAATAILAPARAETPVGSADPVQVATEAAPVITVSGHFRLVVPAGWDSVIDSPSTLAPDDGEPAAASRFMGHRGAKSVRASRCTTMSAVAGRTDPINRYLSVFARPAFGVTPEGSAYGPVGDATLAGRWRPGICFRRRRRTTTADGGGAYSSRRPASPRRSARRFRVRERPRSGCDRRSYRRRVRW